jgi:hypothetical protein
MVSATVLFAPITIPILLRRRRMLHQAGRSASSDNGRRILAWIRGQGVPDEAMSVTTEECDDGSGSESIHRRFSFGGPPATPTMRNIRLEMPDTPLVELADTSPRVELSDTQLSPTEIINKYRRNPDEVRGNVPCHVSEGDNYSEACSDSGYESDDVRGKRGISAPGDEVRCFPMRYCKSAISPPGSSGLGGTLAPRSVRHRPGEGGASLACLEYSGASRTSSSQGPACEYFWPVEQPGPYTVDEETPHEFLSLPAARVALPFSPHDSGDILMPIEIGGGEPDLPYQQPRQEQHITAPPVRSHDSQLQDVYELSAGLQIAARSLEDEAPLLLSHPGSPPGNSDPDIRSSILCFSDPSHLDEGPRNMVN